MPGSGGYFSIRDFNREMTTFSFRTGNITAISIAGFITQFGALRVATQNIILGVMAAEGWVGDRTPLSQLPATNPQSRREQKWLVHFSDNLPFFDDPLNAIPNEGFGKPFTAEVGTAKIMGYGGGTDSALLVNTDDADLAHPQIAAWKTAFEAIARSPYGGTVIVNRIEVVGRNT